eukprot:10546309-Lingulodinium_polyedra.AAC.1
MNGDWNVGVACSCPLQCMRTYVMVSGMNAHGMNAYGGGLYCHRARGSSSSSMHFMFGIVGIAMLFVVAVPA